MLNRAQLPDDIDALKALLHAQLDQTQALREAHDTLKEAHQTLCIERDLLRQEKHFDKQEIQRLMLLLFKLKRQVFGQKSEKLLRQIDQLELELEELHINQGERVQKAKLAEPAARKAPTRRPLPEHLPRDIQEHLPQAAACPDCGGAWQRLGEDVSEVLEYIPSSLRVVRHVRPRLSCRCCDRMAQAPAPSRPIARSFAGPGLLSHVMVSKYLDHQPLYRQCQIAARENVELSESTMGDWVGATHHVLRPLLNALQRYVFQASKLHTDDTPINVLAPGTGKTRQARLWVYTRDDRPSGDAAAPAVWFRYSPDRKGIHPQTHLKDYVGIVQADAFAGYDKVYASGRVIEAGCWAHARRRFYDIHAKQATPITTHVLDQIGALYKIEAGIRGNPPDMRRAARQERAKSIVTALHAWLREQLPTVSRKSETADAIGYAMNHWLALTRLLDDGRIEIDNNAAERALRGISLGRKNYLFLGSDAGGERAATMYSLLGSAKLNGINPQAYLRQTASTNYCPGTLRFNCRSPTIILGLRQHGPDRMLTEYRIIGTNGDDTIVTGGKNDVIAGGAGADNLTGGTGMDTFTFAAGDSTLANMDVITGFRAAGGNNDGALDVIDLTAVDAAASQDAAVVYDAATNSLGGSVAEALEALAQINVTNNVAMVFQRGGNTYVYVESTGSGQTYQVGDTGIQFTGLVGTVGQAFSGLVIDGI